MFFISSFVRDECWKSASCSWHQPASCTKTWRGKLYFFYTFFGWHALCKFLLFGYLVDQPTLLLLRVSSLHPLFWQVYAPALIVGDMIHVSGHVPWLEGGGFIQVDTFANLSQRRNCMVCSWKSATLNLSFAVEAFNERVIIGFRVELLQSIHILLIIQFVLGQGGVGSWAWGWGWSCKEDRWETFFAELTFLAFANFCQFLWKSGLTKWLTFPCLCLGLYVLATLKKYLGSLDKWVMLVFDTT